MLAALHTWIQWISLGSAVFPLPWLRVCRECTLVLVSQHIENKGARFPLLQLIRIFFFMRVSFWYNVRLRVWKNDKLPERFIFLPAAGICLRLQQIISERLFTVSAKTKKQDIREQWENYCVFKACRSPHVLRANKRRHLSQDADVKVLRNADLDVKDYINSSKWLAAWFGKM